VFTAQPETTDEALAAAGKQSPYYSVRKERPAHYSMEWSTDIGWGSLCYPVVIFIGRGLLRRHVKTVVLTASRNDVLRAPP